MSTNLYVLVSSIRYLWLRLQENRRSNVLEYLVFHRRLTFSLIFLKYFLFWNWSKTILFVLLYGTFEEAKTQSSCCKSLIQCTTKVKSPKIVELLRVRSRTSWLVICVDNSVITISWKRLQYQLLKCGLQLNLHDFALCIFTN